MHRQHELITDSAGSGGRVIGKKDADGTLEVLLDDGTIVRLDAHLLQRQSDGTHQLPGRWVELAREVSIPAVEERASFEKKRVERDAVVIEKHVQREDVRLDEPLVQEDLEVTRVPVNRFVDAPPDVRTEGETLIIPCIEEVIVYEKRLRLREELHVRRVRHHSRHPTTVTVRREELEVSRRPGHQTTSRLANDAVNESNNIERRHEEEES